MLRDRKGASGVVCVGAFGRGHDVLYIVGEDPCQRLNFTVHDIVEETRQVIFFQFGI